MVSTIRAKILGTIVAFILLQASCSKDCPVCPTQTTVTFQIGAVYNPARPWNAVPTIGVTAAFVGDPVPKVDYFRVNDSLISPCDQGFPCFDVTMQARSRDVHIETVVNSVLIERTITPPDSFHLIEPLQSVVPAGAPLTIRWSKSSGADAYGVSLLVTSTYPEKDTVFFDTSYCSTDTVVTVRGDVLVSSASLTFQLAAGKGPCLEAGDSANVVVSSFRGFVTGVFNLGMFDRLIE